MSLEKRHYAQVVRPSPTHPASHIAPSKGSTCPICTGNQCLHSHMRKTGREEREGRSLTSPEIQARMKVAAGHVLHRGMGWDFSGFCTLF